MISSTIPNYPDFNKYFRKRPFDQDAFDIEQTADNTYKKIKAMPPSVNLSSQQTTKSTRTSFASPSRSFHVGTNNYSFPSDLTRFDSKYYESDVESDLFSDTPRIIDLFTGDSLESIIPSEEKLQISRRLKRPIELTENQYEVSNILETMEENKTLIDESPLHSLKRIRTSKEHMCNFIEEEEEIDSGIHSRPIEVIKEIKIGYNTLSSNKADSIVSLEKPETLQSLSLYVHGKNPSNIKFTVPYQKAIARYMRSQFQHLNNNEEYGNKGKELILYRPINDESKDFLVDSNVKIFEIPEETMDLENQNDAFNCINNVEEDQMDID